MMDDANDPAAMPADATTPATDTAVEPAAEEPAAEEPAAEETQA